MTGTLAWVPTAAYRRALGLGVGGLVAGVALGSPDLAVLGVPLALSCALASRARPPLRSAPVLVRAPSTASVGEPLAVTVEVTGAAAAARAELVVVATPQGRVGVRRRRSRRRLAATAEPTARGRRLLARPDALLVAADGLAVVGPLVGPVHEVLVVPAVTAAGAGPLPPHATSVVGRHRTRRSGEGPDLHAVEEFRPGDRLRHVDWRATARRGQGPGGLQVHVRRATVEAEGQVVLLLDTRGDLDADVAGWASPAETDGGAVAPGSSLDLIVTTAVALAAAHLGAGDRVGMVDLTVPTAAVRPGGGRRQLQRLRLALAATTATGAATARRGAGARQGSGVPTGSGPRHGSGPGEHSGPRQDRVELPRRLLAQVPARALAVVLSPFLDDRTSDLVLALHSHGRTTVAVDCLPPDLEPDAASPVGAAALGVVLLEHERRLDRLRGAGVAVLPAGADLGRATRALVLARDRGRR
ncbi:DUF58 domain-containing protein [Aquipuribacter hungaricus]|uniref:DUF58 domain-containing protein n=1 Tax=Aquipuribacter hungaricus TaxID=545624 RepID=UPI00361CCF80